MTAVRKVRGEVNPADLFSKHLPSRDQIHQLTSLFGCECRDGRAASAPLLRPHGAEGQKGGHLSDDNVLPNFNQYEAELHDEKMLSQLSKPEFILKTLPKVEAANIQPDLEDWVTGVIEGWESTRAKRGELKTEALLRCGYPRLPAMESEL